MAIFAALALLAAIIGLVYVVRRFRAERREVERVRALFSRYVPPAVVGELLRRKDPRLYTGRSMHATILVCRIWNFAGFAETLTPEETLRYLNEFFTLTGTSIHKHRGMVDKFLSDGIIGVFGVPIEDPFQEENALRAALDIVRLVDAMDKRWRAQGRRSMHVGIGISSGKVIAGDAGYNERREFTVVGPETLIAARLQDVTLDLNAYIVASAATCDIVRDTFSLVPIKGHPLPGIKRLADAFIVRGLKKYDGDTLRMPGASAFAETKVDHPKPAPPPAVTPVAPASAPASAPAPAGATPSVATTMHPFTPRTSPPPPDTAPFPRIELPDPPPALRPRRRPVSGNHTPFEFPEMPLRFLDTQSDTPMLPDPPAPRAVYEDRDGPPLQLPP